MAQSRYVLTAVANGAGDAVTEQVNPRGALEWNVEQVTVTSTSAAASECSVEVNGNPVCSSSAGNSDEADGDPPIRLTSRDQMQIAWANCTPGATCTAVIYYEPSSG